jgi:hypothetical protein
LHDESRGHLAPAPVQCALKLFSVHPAGGWRQHGAVMGKENWLGMEGHLA